MSAAQGGHEATVRALLAAGASLSATAASPANPDHLGSALHAAVLGEPPRSLAVIRCLVAAGASLAATDGAGRTPRHLALREKQRQAARLLLELECAPQARGEAPQLGKGG